MARFGRVDCSVNCAGVEGERAPVHESSVENWDRVLGVNARGAFLCMRAVIRQMLKQAPPLVGAAVEEGGAAGTGRPVANAEGGGGGSRVPIDTCNYSIVNISSSAGQSGMPEFSAYSASKHAMIGLTRTAAKEYAGNGIRVCTPQPLKSLTPV